MTTLYLRNTTSESHKKLPKNCHTYIVIDKERDVKVADINYRHRPKNAGGYAWCALVINPFATNSFEIEKVAYSKDIKKLCEIVKYMYTREGEIPSHWR